MRRLAVDRDGGRRAQTSSISCTAAPTTDLSGVTYKVHVDGHNQLPCITGEVDESPRQHFF